MPVSSLAPILPFVSLFPIHFRSTSLQTPQHLQFCKAHPNPHSPVAFSPRDAPSPGSQPRVAGGCARAPLCKTSLASVGQSHPQPGRPPVVSPVTAFPGCQLQGTTVFAPGSRVDGEGNLGDLQQKVPAGLCAAFPHCGTSAPRPPTPAPSETKTAPRSPAKLCSVTAERHETTSDSQNQGRKGEQAGRELSPLAPCPAHLPAQGAPRLIWPPNRVKLKQAERWRAEMN